MTIFRMMFQITSNQASSHQCDKSRAKTTEAHKHRQIRHKNGEESRWPNARPPPAPTVGRLPTRYSPVRHSVTKTSFRRNRSKCFVRLACVKHAASVHPEPGSNSHVKSFNPARISGFSKSETSSYRNLDSGFTVFKVCFIKSCSFIFR